VIHRVPTENLAAPPVLQKMNLFTGLQQFSNSVNQQLTERANKEIREFGENASRAESGAKNKGHRTNASGTTELYFCIFNVNLSPF
jgi:hypothetical protein